MTTIVFGMITVLVLLFLFFATGTKTPSRPISQLPTPSLGVRVLVNEKKIIDAIKLYRREANTSLNEAKQVVDSMRS